MRYRDPSAVVPLLVQRSRTNDARAALAEDSGMVTWWGTRSECTSAIARLERAASLTPPQAARAIEVLRALAPGWNEILPGESVRETACRLLRVHSLGGAMRCNWRPRSSCPGAGRPVSVFWHTTTG
jgi:hypothetical protein